jgi:hypothetical protein
VLVRDSSGYRVVSGHGQFHAAVLARRLNPKAGETIPAIVLETENQTTGERTTFDAEVRSFRRSGPIPEIEWGFLNSLNLT